MFEEYFTDDTGWILAIMGAGFSTVGALINNLFLMHTEAMWFWMISNPLLLVWAYGTLRFDFIYQNRKMYEKQVWWNGGLSASALCCMYAIFALSNFYGLKIIGG